MSLCTRNIQAMSTRRAFAPFQSTQRMPVRVRAAGDGSEAAATASTSSAPAKVPVLSWQTDKENARDVFAFGGSAPERVNGRVAMLGFAGIAATEYFKHTPALEQFGESWFIVIVYSVLLTFGSLAPKLVSGSSLQDLHATATSANLGGQGPAAALSIFDTNLELWTGRIAMLGLVGLVANEVLVKGDAFF